MAEVGSGEIDDEFCARCDGVEELEVEHSLTLGFFRCAPVGVPFDREQGRKRRQPELGRELLEVGEVGEVVNLGEEDGLSGAVET